MKKSTVNLLRRFLCLFAFALAGTSFVSCNLESKAEESDFVYEVINNTSVVLTVRNYIIDYSKDSNGDIVFRSKLVKIPVGGTHDFCYQLDDLTSRYVNSTNKDQVFLGASYYPKGKWEWFGFENGLKNNGRKHIITATDAAEDHCINGVETWDVLEGYELDTVDNSYDFVYEIVNNSSKNLSVSNYLKQYTSDKSDYSHLAITKTEVIEPGITYDFNYSVTSLKSKYGKENVYMGAFCFPEGKWENFGWENRNEMNGRKHVLTVTDNSLDYVDVDNTWTVLNGYRMESNVENYDFVYEIVNQTSGKLTVSNYIKDYTRDKYLAITDTFVIEKDESHRFCYDTSDLLKRYGTSTKIKMGAFYWPENTWETDNYENSLSSSGKMHTVTVLDGDGVKNMYGKSVTSNLEDLSL